VDTEILCEGSLESVHLQEQEGKGVGISSMMGGEWKGFSGHIKRRAVVLTEFKVCIALPHCQSIASEFVTFLYPPTDLK
jgi:hypothetical protein